MPFLVLMAFSIADDNTGKDGIMTERVLDFQTEENFIRLEDSMFDHVIHIINNNLSNGCYIDDDFPEPVKFLTENDIVDLDLTTIISIPEE